MEQILLPNKVELQKLKRNEYILTVEPCHPGYAHTLGNALRRMLLSSLPGAAVTDVKIKGADHEFTTIPHVKEDVLDIALNLKQMRIAVHTDEPVRLKLHVKGETEVTAGDIEKNAEVEIADTDFHIATLTNKAAELDMEIIVRRGRGASPVEDRVKGDKEIGLIALDVVFSPIKIVGYKVENIRVGQQTNYEKLVLNFETDGTISGEDAVREATKLLLDHFNIILNFGSSVSPEAEEEEQSEEGKKKRGRPKKK